MRKPLNFDIKYRVILIWFVINAIIGFIIAFILSIWIKNSFLNILLITQTITYFLSIIIISSAYALGYITHNNPIWLALLINNTGVAIVTLASIKICSLFMKLFLYNPAVEKITSIFYELFFPIIIFAVTINTIGIFIERFRHNRLYLIKNLNNLKNQISNLDIQSNLEKEFTFIEKEIYHKIKYKNILYFASHGKSSTIHTSDGDYNISQLLKELADTIPSDIFLRIHKQFIVNINFIHRKQYYKGGRYIIHLKDEDDTVLPVGSSYTAILNEKLKI